MEEDVGMGSYYNKCKKDHLATAKDLSKTNPERVCKPVLLACGFNGFGQLKLVNKRIMLQFEEIQTPFQFNNDDLLVACFWSCLAVANGCFLYLQGFLSNCSKSKKSIQTDVPIKCLDICDKFCLLLTENGKVYKLKPGSDELKEIKFQTNLTSIIPQKRNIFGVSKLVNLEIGHIACGNNITIAASTTNSIFSGTTQIYQFPKHQHIKQLKCGFEHVLLLTTNGDIYAWGNGLRGQLGLEILRVQETPVLIEALAGIKILYIAAGGWHSAAISTFGDVYAWGFNSNGQLGLRLYKTSATTLKEPSVYPLPQLIDVSTCHCRSNSDEPVELCYPIEVAAGGRHTILKMNCGSVYGCGWNAYGQLGLTNFQQCCDSFKFVYQVEESNIKRKEIICGSWCTIIKQ